jgi:hypothetical protein
MRLRTGIAIGLGVGYVLGARAGRARFEQIRSAWNRFARSPGVQELAEPIRQAVEPTVWSARDSVDEVRHGPAGLSADQVRERLARRGTVGGGFDVHPPEEILKERM